MPTPTTHTTLLDRFALTITTRVGSMGFFLTIVTWTLLWTMYNIIASEFPQLHLHAFDPFPAFVAYLLISNVIQILLMPLIMVGQNIQNKTGDIRAELDFEVNKKAEAEIELIFDYLAHLGILLTEIAEELNIEAPSRLNIIEEEFDAIADVDSTDDVVEKVGLSLRCQASRSR